MTIHINSDISCSSISEKVIMTSTILGKTVTIRNDKNNTIKTYKCNILSKNNESILYKKYFSTNSATVTFASAIRLCQYRATRSAVKQAGEHRAESQKTQEQGYANGGWAMSLESTESPMLERTDAEKSSTNFCRIKMGLQDLKCPARKHVWKHESSKKKIERNCKELLQRDKPIYHGLEVLFVRYR